MADFNLLVLGTSIMWGQGLEDSDKMHAMLAKVLQPEFPNRTVNTIFLAHSGASTGYKRDGSIDTRHEPRIAGEIPTNYPTIFQQVEAFDDTKVDPDAVDLIVLDAGINDVKVTTVVDPLTSPRKIGTLVEIYCHQHMILLLEQITAKFKNATIVIIGYYQMITAQTEEGYIHTLLKAYGKVPSGVVADMIIKALLRRPIRRRILTNCHTFAARSFTAFQHAAKQVNKSLDSERIFVVPSAIPSKHSALTADAWLFGINDDLSPQDPMLHSRAADCKSAPHKRTDQLTCEKASAGHPNPKGAKAYAEAIYKVLKDKDRL